MLFFLSACFLAAPTPNPDVTCYDGSTAEAGECPEDREDSSDTAYAADTAEDIGGDTAGAVDSDSPCHSLEGRAGTGCYETRPYFVIDMETAVQVSQSDFVAWDVGIRAAPEGWIAINDLGAWISFRDASRTGWTEDILDHLSYVDQYGEEHAIGVLNSSPDGKSVAVGEIVGAEGDWVVPMVDAGETVTVTFTLDISGLAVGKGDWVELDLNSYQRWSSDQVTSIESQFGDAVGTRFLFR